MSGPSSSARTLLHLRRPEAAEREIRGALAHEPQRAESHAVLAIALSNQGKFAEALGEANEAVRLAAASWYPHYVAGQVLHRAKQEAKALQATRTALSIDPARPRVWRQLAWIHLGREEWMLSAQAAREGLKLDPSDGDLVSALATGAADLAACAFRESLRLDPTDSHSREMLVSALKQRNPLYRMLFRALKGIGRTRLWLPLWLWVVFFGILTLAYWVLWVADALLTLRLARGPYNWQLFADNLRGAHLSGIALAVGIAFLVAGIPLTLPDLSAAGLATLALVTPIEEAAAATTEWGRRFLACWATLLTAALTLGLALSGMLPEPNPNLAPMAMLAALATVWLAVAIEWCFKPRVSVTPPRCG